MRPIIETYKELTEMAVRGLIEIHNPKSKRLVNLQDAEFILTKKGKILITLDKNDCFDD